MDTPYCDTCGTTVTFTETWGWVHLVDGRAMPPHLDQNDHEASVEKWIAKFEQDTEDER